MASCNVFLLGAGSPARGGRPSALKEIAQNTRVMDWQITSFKSVASPSDIHYLGGYHVEDVINSYRQINYTVIPDWQERSILHTLLKAPFDGQASIAAYSDTLFREETVERLLTVSADVVFCVDSCWRDRFESRNEEDIYIAETLNVELAPENSMEVEFTGLVYFSRRAIGYLADIDEEEVGESILDLLEYLSKFDLSIRPFDVAGAWAELNSPDDIARFVLGTKSETLARLESQVSLSHIGKQVSFSCEQWLKNSPNLLDDICNVFAGANIIVRSSAKAEDGWLSSNAGGFESYLNVDGQDKGAIKDAVESVIASYGQYSPDDQVLVQLFLTDIRAAGVVFTCSLETGAPYYRFNFDDTSQSTESVTAGISNKLRTIILSRFKTESLENIEPALVPVLEAVVELEQLLGFDKLDIEFAVDQKGLVHILQVRPIAVDHSNFELSISKIERSLFQAENKFRTKQFQSPFSLGTKAPFANMPDWNPAEIIGVRPKPLAFSLYRHLITNDVWAQQRVEYGYRDVRPCPLIISFSGQPYVDTRASFNSFVPAVLSEDIATRLVEAYVDILSENPILHDKVEFDVAFTVWTPDFARTASERLLPYGVQPIDILQLESALKEITKKALSRLTKDIQSVEFMSARRKVICESDISAIDKVFSLLEDCKRYGTLAFSHAARAGFVATALLSSFVQLGIITEARKLAFLKSFSTVAGEMNRDKYAYNCGDLSSDSLINCYGHLRPGTYEVSTEAYWENPKSYLFSGLVHPPEQDIEFSFTRLEEKGIERVLNELGSNLSVEEFGQFLVDAIQSRESVKFEFTRNLSAALDFCVEQGKALGFSREDLSYLTYADLEALKLNIYSFESWSQLIDIRKQEYKITCTVELPSLIQSSVDFYCFERPRSQPNFVTAEKVCAEVALLVSSQEQNFRNKIILIPQADPGYDWLLSQGIAGLITQYGGANSHMAIRAAEMGLPAAIGVGEKLYEKLSHLKQIELDCGNRLIREVL